MPAIKAVQAADELGFEPIDRPPDVDQVLGQSVCRDPVDELVDECIDSLIDTVSRIRHRERFHEYIVPNICSSGHGPMWLPGGYSHFGNNIAGRGTGTGSPRPPAALRRPSSLPIGGQVDPLARHIRVALAVRVVIGGVAERAPDLHHVS